MLFKNLVLNKKYNFFKKIYLWNISFYGSNILKIYLNICELMFLLI